MSLEEEMLLAQETIVVLAGDLDSLREEVKTGRELIDVISKLAENQAKQIEFLKDELTYVKSKLPRYTELGTDIELNFQNIAVKKND